MVNTMKIGISIDKAGRLVLPKEVRQKLDLEAGDLLDAELVANEVRLKRKFSSPAGFQRVEGRLVWDVPGAAASLEEIQDAFERGRRERDNRASGM